MREISEELKIKLAGLLPINSDFTVKFTPKDYDEIPVEFKPIFILKPWTNNQMKQLALVANNEEKAISLIVSQIVDIQNLYNISTGEEEQFDPQTIGNKIPKKILLSLMSELTRISGL